MKNTCHAHVHLRARSRLKESSSIIIMLCGKVCDYVKQYISVSDFFLSVVSRGLFEKLLFVYFLNIHLQIPLDCTRQSVCVCECLTTHKDDEFFIGCWLT